MVIFFSFRKEFTKKERTLEGHLTKRREKKPLEGHEKLMKKMEGQENSTASHAKSYQTISGRKSFTTELTTVSIIISTSSIHLKEKKPH